MASLRCVISYVRSEFPRRKILDRQLELSAISQIMSLCSYIEFFPSFCQTFFLFFQFFCFKQRLYLFIERLKTQRLVNVRAVYCKFSKLLRCPFYYPARIRYHSSVVVKISVSRRITRRLTVVTVSQEVSRVEGTVASDALLRLLLWEIIET